MRKAEGESVQSIENRKEAIQVNTDYFSEDAQIEATDAQIKDYVHRYFRSDLVERAIATMKCESKGNSKAIGDNGTSYGLWQIHLPAHPTISKEQALDPEWSTQWAAEKFAVNPKIWSCYRILYEE